MLYTPTLDEDNSESAAAFRDVDENDTFAGKNISVDPPPLPALPTILAVKVDPAAGNVVTVTVARLETADEANTLLLVKAMATGRQQSVTTTALLVIASSRVDTLPALDMVAQYTE
jgi:hypothetical protein